MVRARAGSLEGRRRAHRHRRDQAPQEHRGPRRNRGDGHRARPAAFPRPQGNAGNLRQGEGAVRSAQARRSGAADGQLRRHGGAAHCLRHAVARRAETVAANSIAVRRIIARSMCDNSRRKSCIWRSSTLVLGVAWPCAKPPPPRTFRISAECTTPGYRQLQRDRARWRKERNVMKSNTKATGFVLGFALALAGTASAADLKMMTGPQGGSWIPLGGQLKDMWEKAIPGTSVQVLPGAGIANVRGIEEAKADIGFGNSISTVDAMTGKAPFNKPHDNVCNIATLDPQYIHFVMVANAGINKVADLKGKSITTQQRGNTGEQITRQFLEVNGVTYNDLKVSLVGYTDSVTRRQHGHAVAFALTTQIAAHAQTLATVAKDIASLTPKGMAAGVGVPFHPASAKYYKAAGITVKTR